MNVQVLQSIFQQKFGITLSPQELAELTTTTDTSGRSPFRPRQLNDLTLQPRADDPRPTFFPSAQVPRDWDTKTTHEFPKLMWSKQGQEITIPPGKDAKEQEKAYEAKGYTHQPPADESQMDAIEREMKQLSAEERAFVLNLEREARMRRIQERMGQLSDDELAVIAGQAKGKK